MTQQQTKPIKPQTLYGQQTEQGLDTHMARIEENACIGCTACIRACPVDAIVGAHKMMHTVIRGECTGCALCVTACPVDCIVMDQIEPQHLPQNPILSNLGNPRIDATEHALMRYEARQLRLKKQRQPKAHIQATLNKTDIHALLAKAQNTAQTRSAQGRAVTQTEQIQAKNIDKQQQRAAYRRAQKQLRYGSEQEKTSALAYLRSLKNDE